MEYVEYLRARRALIIYTVVALATAAIVVASIHFAHVHGSRSGAAIVIDSSRPQSAGATDAISPGRIYLDLIFAGAAFCSMVFASFRSWSLNRENARANFAFTKPISRESLALKYMSVDGAAIVGSFVVASVAALGALGALGFGNIVTSGPLSAWVALCGLGAAFLWFGLLQAITASLPGGGGVIVGLSWPVFIGLLALPSITWLGPIVPALARALDYLNPLSYLPSVSQSNHRGLSIDTYAGLSLPLETALVWALALVACAIAARIWRRFEA